MKTGTLAIAACLCLCLTVASAESPASISTNDRFVNFNFERVEIRMLVKIVGEMTDKRFVLDDNIEGSVSVVTPTKVPRTEVYNLFLSILESNGYSVREDAGAYHIVPLEGSALPIAPFLAPDDVSDGISTRVFMLENISALDMVKVVAPMVRGGTEGAVVPFVPTNHLVVTDTSASLRRVGGIIKELDQPGTSRTVEVHALEYASAAEVSRQLSMAMQGAASAGEGVARHLRQMASGEGSLPSQVMAIPASQSNAVILVGSPREIIEMKRIARMLDVEPTQGGGRLHAIFLKYMSAEDGVEGLKALLADSTDENQMRVSIEADKSSNALLVNAAPHEFQWIRELVEKIDRSPQQVMVEILIVEINESRGLDLGVQWTTVDAPAEGRTTVLGRSRPGEVDTLQRAIETGEYPRGLALGLSTGLAPDGSPLVPFLIEALEREQDINILSKVPLWAQNNKEASVSVVENIPILKSTIEGGAGTSRDVIQNIERMDVGIKLTFTPHVNPDNEITLRLRPSIEAILSEGPADQPFTPTIAKREVQTTVTVPDGSTIVISGLVREDKVQQKHKVPLLGDIPVLGGLFRYTSDSVRRTNLLIFVSPHIVTDMAQAREKQEHWESEAGVSYPGVRQVQEIDPSQ